MGVYFERALQRLGHQVQQILPKDIDTLRQEYDFYFHIDDGHYDFVMPKKLHPKIYYVSDVHLKKPFTKVKKLIWEGVYDLVFCPMRKEIEILRRRSPVEIIWMNVGFDPEIHKRLELKRVYDVGFVGNDGGIPRKFYLQEIRERYPNSYLGRADYRKMSKIYSSSKIGFSYPIRSECFTMRNYEIMACGAMLLMKRLRDDSAQKLGFIDRKHLVTFDGPEDLFALIKYYLHNKEERQAIAEAGYQLTTQKHSYTLRLQEMLDIIKNKFNL